MIFSEYQLRSTPLTLWTLFRLFFSFFSMRSLDGALPWWVSSWIRRSRRLARMEWNLVVARFLGSSCPHRNEHSDWFWCRMWAQLGIFLVKLWRHWDSNCTTRSHWMKVRGRFHLEPSCKCFHCTEHSRLSRICPRLDWIEFLVRNLVELEIHWRTTSTSCRNLDWQSNEKIL